MGCTGSAAVAAGGSGGGQSSSCPAEEVSAFATQDEDGAPVCAICISGLGRAETFALPGCGHTFHALCLACALQVSPLCPVCRKDVAPETTARIAKEIAGDDSQAGSLLAAEIVVELRSRGKASGSGQQPKVSPEETADGIRAAARKGDCSKIPAISALLGHSKDASGRPPQQPLVRLAAVEALRELVPTFPSTWPGLPHVLNLLQSVVASDRDAEVRGRAAHALREVCPRGDEAALGALRLALEDKRANEELRLYAADAVQAIAAPNDEQSLRTAVVALADADCSVRSVGFSTLKAICPAPGGSPRLLEDLLSLVSTHRDPEVRALALELVAQVEEPGGERGIRAACAVLCDREEQVAKAALAALRRLWRHGDAQAVETLSACVKVGQLQAPCALVRCSALEVLQHLAERGDAVALDTAVAALSDEDGSVQAAGLQALKLLCVRGQGEVSSRLIALLDHRDEEVRRLAAEALGHAASAQDGRAVARLQALRAVEELQVTAEQALKQLA